MFYLVSGVVAAASTALIGWAPFADSGLLGTDFVGRDVWHQVLLGGQAMELTAVLATGGAYLLGTAWGLAAATMFRTVWCLHYLRARGGCHLATGRAEAALDDHTACGDLMARWSLDLPALMPWRVDAAHAHLALGRPQQARALAESQLTRAGPRPGAPRAAALRVLAATAPLAQRPTLLREAAEMLRTCGDRLELAHTLADLSQAHRSLGDFRRARMTVRRARELAGDCRADALRRRLLPDIDPAVQGRTAAGGDPGPGAEDGPEPGMEAFNSLSDAERRVAALAAQGSTNRQIADRLFITVSTVGQHLTKIYRKLDVTRRADLLLKLGPRIGNIA